jgi:hypothetical protein
MTTAARTATFLCMSASGGESEQTDRIMPAETALAPEIAHDRRQLLRRSEHHRLEEARTVVLCLPLRERFLRALGCSRAEER